MINLEEVKVVNIAFAWAKDIEKSWSGTAYQIVKQFEKHGYKVNLIDINLNIIEKITKRLFHIFKLDYSAYKYENNLYKKKIEKKMVNAPLFLFGLPKLNVNVPIYIYQDMNFNYLYDLAQKYPDKYKVSGFHYDLTQLKLMSDDHNNSLLKASKVFTMGKFLKDYFDENYNEEISSKVVHVGGGFNFEIDNTSIANKENSFLFVGKDFYRKSGDLVIKAFEKIGDTIPDAKLYIIGPNEKPEFTNQNIIYLGNKSFNETREYFNKCKVFVMPSRFEAYGLVFLEALVSGDIIIGTDEYEMSNFINDENGYKVNLDVNSIAAAMLSAIKNDSLSRKVISDRKKYLSMYSWDAVFERMKREMNE